MERLLETARPVCDQAEVFAVDTEETTCTFQNAAFHDLETSFRGGVSLRVIKNGRLGFAYTRNLMDSGELLQNAVDSLHGGVEARFDFPDTTSVPRLSTSHPDLKSLNSEVMVQECARVSDQLSGCTTGEVAVTSWKHHQCTRIVNSNGTDLSYEGSFFCTYVLVSYPGTRTGILRILCRPGFAAVPDDVLDELVALYNPSVKSVKPRLGRMKVLFMPNALVTVTWRLQSALSAKSVFEKVSPIIHKVGQQVFSEALTVLDDPTDDSCPRARPFDDEGVATARLTLIENGEVRSFYNDLHHAAKLAVPPSGHGYRTDKWFGDPVEMPPTPAAAHLRIQPGSESLAELIKSMDRGLIVEGALGFHSGNIPNGDFSIGANPGLYVENGEIVGRVKDAMVAGNIYETLQRIVAVGDTPAPCFGWSRTPAILCENVSVASKG